MNRRSKTTVKSRKIIKSQVVTIGEFEVVIQFKKIKNLYLRLHKETGAITVTAPSAMPMSFIEQFVLSRREWIKIQQDKILESSGKTTKLMIQLMDGDRILLWGNRYPLLIQEGQKKNEMIFQDNVVVMRLKKPFADTTYEERYSLVKEWYKRELNEMIPSLISRWEDIIGVKSSEYYLRDMKSQWGSCHIIKKKICLNVQLAKHPIICLEYVIVHELVHLLEPSHNQRFKTYMTRYLPNWMEIKQLLNRNIMAD